ncbi:MAG: hypothetical protein WEB87_05105 [Bacteriovoracaceae bacterium]
MIILILFLSFPAYAGLAQLSEQEAFKYEFEQKKQKQVEVKLPARIKKKTDPKIDQLLQKLKENDASMAAILESNNKKIIVKKYEEKLLALTRLRGVLLNSALATNLRPTTMIVRLGKQEYFESAELRCHGTSYGKRIQAKCDLLVTDTRQYQIDAQIWDLDGAEGLIADEFYSGEEKAFLTSSFASFFEGVMDGARDRILTPYGETTRVNAKNKVLSGLMGVANNTNKKIKESSEKNIQVALVNAGKEVIVFLDKQLEL